MNTENNEGNEKKRWIWVCLGLIIAVFGGLFTLFCLFLFLVQFTSADSGQREGGVFFGVLALVIGIPLLVIGILLILRKGKTPTVNLGSSNNL